MNTTSSSILPVYKVTTPIMIEGHQQQPESPASYYRRNNNNSRGDDCCEMVVDAATACLSETFYCFVGRPGTAKRCAFWLLAGTFIVCITVAVLMLSLKAAGCIDDATYFGTTTQFPILRPPFKVKELNKSLTHPLIPIPNSNGFYRWDGSRTDN